MNFQTLFKAIDDVDFVHDSLRCDTSILGELYRGLLTLTDREKALECLSYIADGLASEKIYLTNVSEAKIDATIKRIKADSKLMSLEMLALNYAMTEDLITEILNYDESNKI